MFVFIWLILIVGVLVIPLFLSTSDPRTGEGRRLVDALRAHCLRGAAPAVEFDGGTQVAFQLGGRPAWFRVPDGEGRALLEVAGDGLSAKPELAVYRQGPRVAVEDHVIGDPAFDRAWIVQGDLHRRVFAPESRAVSVSGIQALRNLPDPSVKIQRGRVRVSVGRVPTEPEVHAMLNAARCVLEALRPNELEGVLWVEAREDLRPLCQVCGSEEGAALVRCKSCRTPHHADCWAYAGRCSTYGCGERSSLRA